MLSAEEEARFLQQLAFGAGGLDEHFGSFEELVLPLAAMAQQHHPLAFEQGSCSSEGEAFTATGSKEEPGVHATSKGGKAFGHYRRKKTNKAPRKRTFIANMTKYNSMETGALESAARGVGAGPTSGSHSLSAYGTAQSQQGTLAFSAGAAPALYGLTSNGSEVLANGLAGNYLGSGFDASDVSLTSANGLPLSLANLPTVAAPVVWGQKHAASAAASHSTTTSSSFTDLLTGTNAFTALTPQQHQSYNNNNKSSSQEANAAAAAAAAVAMAISGAGNGGSRAQQQRQMSSIIPQGPPKVSFDLFPELAALAGGDVRPLVTGAPVAAQRACFSRAVVTGMEAMGWGAAAAAPAPAPPAREAAPEASTRSATSSHTAAAAPATSPGATSVPQLQPYSSDCSLLSSQQTAAAVVAAVAAAAATPATSGSHPTSGAMPLTPMVSGNSTSTGTAAPAATQQVGRGGRKAAAATTAGRAAAGGRGTKRAAHQMSNGMARSSTMVGAAPWDALPTAPAPTTNSTDALEQQQQVARPAPFALPMHGVSPTGTVVPGGAGELRVSQLVSVGAYGMVYQGRWSNREVAVKMMRPPKQGEVLCAGDVLRSFRHEADLLRQLAHPNIVALRHWQDVEPVCIVQDYATHGTLSDYIHSFSSPSASSQYPMNRVLGGAMQSSDLERAVLRRLARRLALSPDALIADLEARSIAASLTSSSFGGAHANQRVLRRYVVLLCLLRDVANAFAYLAAPPAGLNLPPIAHRDVKPANVLLSAQGMALLADFGLAKLCPVSSSSHSSPAPSTHPSSPIAHPELAHMFSDWTSEHEQPHKRARVHDAAAPAAPPAPWDPLEGNDDVDMSWLDSLLVGDEHPATPAAAAAAALPDFLPADTTLMAVPAASHGEVAGSAGTAGAAGEGGQSCSWPLHHGTAHYAAPEDLCAGEGKFALTPAADMFSLGYCMWEALSGARPWAGAPSHEVAAAVGQQGARLPLPATCPPGMAALVARCWSADPALRPSPVQVIAELDSEIRRALGTV